MNIQSISKENANANVTLSASELVLICNMFREQLAKEKSNAKFLELYGDLMLARDLCQYGHVDNFCLGGIVKCRNSIGNGVNGVLSDEDIDKFNNFLEDMPTALDNAEWLNDYVSEIEKIAAQLTMSQFDGYSHILRICDAMKRELTVSAEMEDDL